MYGHLIPYVLPDTVHRMVANAFKSAMNRTAPPAEAQTPTKFAGRHV